MHRTIKPHPHHLRDAACIVAVRLVDLRLQHRLHVPRLDTDHWQARFADSAEKPLGKRARFQSNSLKVVGGIHEHLQQSFRFACHLQFPHDPASLIHDADARLLDRNVQSSKMVHAVLLLMMLEVANADLVTISLKRSTLILQLSTSCRPITPSYGCPKNALCEEIDERAMLVAAEALHEAADQNRLRCRGRRRCGPRRLQANRELLRLLSL